MNKKDVSVKNSVLKVVFMYHLKSYKRLNFQIFKIGDEIPIVKPAKNNDAVKMVDVFHKIVFRNVISAQKYERYWELKNIIKVLRKNPLKYSYNLFKNRLPVFDLK